MPLVKSLLGCLGLVVILVAVSLLALAAGRQIDAIESASVAPPAKRILVPTATPGPPTATPRPTSADNIVTLQAASGNNQVQMFDALRSDATISTFRDGFRCSQISSRLRYEEGGVVMFFYKLDCGGKVGYVNAKWVRR